jgi:hypothetical protein
MLRALTDCDSELRQERLGIKTEVVGTGLTDCNVVQISLGMQPHRQECLCYKKRNPEVGCSGFRGALLVGRALFRG